MALDFTFSCPLPNGVHARPASALEEVARAFNADVVLLNKRTGRSANAKSILSIVGADIRYSDPCLLKVSGADEERAMATLGSFIRNTLPRQESAMPEIPKASSEFKLPPCLRDAGSTFRRGTAVVSGIAQGKVVCAAGYQIPNELPKSGAADPQLEENRLREGLNELVSWYGLRAAAAGRGVESELLIAHRSLARDEEFQNCLFGSVRQGATAAGAIAEAEHRFTALFVSSPNPSLRERAVDIRDVCGQLLQRVYGSAASNRTLTLTEDSIVVADWLTPCQILALDCRLLKGLVLAEAGSTSHTIILARSFGIPTLVGVEMGDAALTGEQEAILDADLGVLVTDITVGARRYYGLERQRLEGRAAALRSFGLRTGMTQDGHRIEVAANTGSVDEAVRAFAAGAEGIGLFRSEMLFLDRVMSPSETEQYETFHRVIEAADGLPVIIRTMDIGGDKPLGYLNLLPESNPFLGYRALRIYPEFEALFRTQIRALLRASAHGPLKIMFPMIAVLEEARWVKRIVAEERIRCADEGIPFDASLPLGAMIEVPSAAFVLDELCREFDFFSVGSNDLLQYFMAADRTNPRLTSLYDPLQPAFLRFLKQIVETVRNAGKWIGLCGEMAAEPGMLPLLAGLGFDEISVAAPAIGRIKAELLQLKRSECSRLCDAALACADVDELKNVLGDYSAAHAVPLAIPGLVVVNADAASKEEAVKLAVDRLYIQGRTERPRVIEEAVWSREAQYTTGFGHGFAMPHCKTRSVAANSIVLLKLAKPVAWESVDDEPVKVVILLVIRDGDSASEHMKLISHLARQIMHEEFRRRIERETQPAALCAMLTEMAE